MVIILGNDHTNTVGLLQSFGRVGIKPVLFLWGVRTMLARSCRYSGRIISSYSPQSCVDKILEEKEGLKDSLIIPSCDAAALIIEKNQKKLTPWFKFQGTNVQNSIELLQEKNNQAAIAQKAGFSVPRIWTYTVGDNIPADIVFPCIIKPLASIYGSKNDLLVCYSIEELKENIALVSSRTPKILLQQYIEKDFDYIVHGVALSDGTVITPTIIRKDLIYPPNVGLSSYCTILPLTDGSLITSIRKYVQEIGYVGLFSVEFIHSKVDNKMYFCELNMRNDGKTGMITKVGINLPYMHYCDMYRLKLPNVLSVTPKKAIWELHHFQSLLHGNISIKTWIQQIKSADIWMIGDKKDWKPIARQFYNWFKFKFRAAKYYE